MGLVIPTMRARLSAFRRRCSVPNDSVACCDASSTVKLSPFLHANTREPLAIQVPRCLESRPQERRAYADLRYLDAFSGWSLAARRFHWLPFNGASFTIHYIYTPLGGASGFAATWDSTSEKPGRVEIEVQPYEGNGLSFINQAQHSTKNMTFDGKDYAVKDAGAPAGAMSSARRVNAGTLVFTEKRNGKVADIQHIQLSTDGKTMTMTIQPASGRRPNVLVFERE